LSQLSNFSKTYQDFLKGSLLFLLSQDVPVHEFYLIIDGDKRSDHRSKELMYKEGVKEIFKKEKCKKEV